MQTKPESDSNRDDIAKSDGDAIDPQVSRDEFLQFCSQGRLVGTEYNIGAVQSLERALRDRNYQVHTFIDRKEAIRPIAMGLGFAVLGFCYWFFTRQESGLLLSALMLGPLAKATLSMRKGTPLVVFGVRPAAPESSGEFRIPGAPEVSAVPTADESFVESATPEPPATSEASLASEISAPSNDSAPSSERKATPTVIIGAHLDSVAAWFAGSFLKQSLWVLLFFMVCSVIAHLLAPWVAVLVAAAGGFYMFGNTSQGGDDNASGVFAVLNCVDRLAEVLDANIVPVFFNFEEEGLFGSSAFFRRYLSKKGSGIPGISIDPKSAYVINFDCVGRGKRIYVSGAKSVSRSLLATPTAQLLGASFTPYYASDHRSFRRPWQAASFARADRYWMFSLEWIHSKADVPEKVDFRYIEEVARIAEEGVRRMVAKEEQQRSAALNAKCRARL